jgi:hypothetical protein
MHASPELFSLTAKRLAMLANDQVGHVVRAITRRDDYPGEIAGTVLGIMPHIVEKAILTSPSLPADMAVRLCERFVNEYETVVKMVSNAGGFSNPIKKAIFNAGFHTMFRREYDDLKPKIDKLWEAARLEQADPIGYLAYITLKRIENAEGRPIESDESIKAANLAIEEVVERVHTVLSGA